MFNIESGNDINFLVSGITKQCYDVRSGEEVNIFYRLVPIVKEGEFKLPVIKISELSYTSAEKLASNYYFPENINLNIL